MDRLPYGASCSQLVAIYTIRQIVQDAGLAEHIAIAVRERIYVDDFLRSAPTVVEALSEATSVKSALANADGGYLTYVINVRNNNRSSFGLTIIAPVGWKRRRKVSRHHLEH